MPLTTAYLSGYFSPKGSFSRLELLAAGAGLYAISLCLDGLMRRFPEVYPAGDMVFYRLGLYLVWALALGKRSRDIGTTFTYGALVGAILPVIGIVFLFQKGAKEREKEAAAAEAARESERESG